MSAEAVVPCDSDNLLCVQSILRRKDDELDIDEKQRILTTPRPTPDLRFSTWEFNRSVYKKFVWITGCSHTNKLYCWWCIFFSDASVWSSTVYETIKKHQRSRKHLSATLSFHKFVGKQSAAAAKPITAHHSQVDDNRQVFQKLIDVVCHLAQKELLFDVHNESISSSRNNFSNLANLLTSNMGEKNSHSLLQIDIINSIVEVMKSHIKSEIRTAKCCALIIEEIPTDIRNGAQLCIILRYVLGSEVHDRFLGYVKESECTSADTLSQVILEVLNGLNCRNRLIAQSYGASMIPEILEEVQQKVQNDYPHAIAVWSIARILNSALLKSCKKIDEVKSFVTVLQALTNFFTKNQKRVNLYDKNCDKRLPYFSYLCIAKTVNEQKLNLIKLFTEISSGKPEEWDGNSILAAENFLTLLQSFNFNFFLSIFNLILQQVRSVQNEFSTKKIKKWLFFTIDKYFDTIYENVLNGNMAPRLKHNITCGRTHYRQIFLQVIDIIGTEMKEHDAELTSMIFIELLNTAKFSAYNFQFPRRRFKVLTYNYHTHINIRPLNKQLKSLFASELKNCKDLDIFAFIRENNLELVYPELLQLAQILVTIPITPHGEECAISSLERIHTHLQNTRGKVRSSELSMISIEQHLMAQLKQSQTFYTDVIEAYLILRQEKSIELE